MKGENQSRRLSYPPVQSGVKAQEEGGKRKDREEVEGGNLHFHLVALLVDFKMISI